MGEKVKSSMQRFSRSAIQPVMFMAVMGLGLAIAVILQLDFMPGFIQSFGKLLKAMMDAMLNNLSIIFCVGIAASLANRKKVEAAILSLIVYLIFLGANNAWLADHNMLATSGDMGFYGTGQALVLGFQVVDMNVFLGMILGVLTGYIHNKFSETQFIDLFSSYAGSRFAFIILIPIVMAFAVLMCYVWPVVNGWITNLSNFIIAAGLLGVFLYSFGNRFLVPTGLHHLLWMPFCYTALGGVATINGQVYTGAVNIFYAEMSNAATITTLDPSLRFATFGFAKIFGSIGIILAFIYCAKPENKEKVKGMLLPSGFVATFAGITEPLDFSFLFISPLLWLVHSILTAVSETLLWALGSRTYMLNGIIDTVVCNSVFSPSVTKFYIAIIFGVIMVGVWFVVFSFLIKKLDIKTPGREDNFDQTIATAGETLTPESGYSAKDVEIVIGGLGGKNNILNVSNCFTRLRCEVTDVALVNDHLLKQCKDCKGVVHDQNNIQIIIGMTVGNLAENVIEALGIG